MFPFIISVSPTVVIGPFAKYFIITPGNVAGLSSSLMVYNFLAGPETMLRNVVGLHQHQGHGCPDGSWFQTHRQTLFHFRWSLF